MDTNRTPVRPGRIVAAIAGASMLLTGVTCLATAPATAATTPTPLGFTVSGLAATPDGGVIAVGNTYDEDLGTNAPHAALVENGVSTQIAGLPTSGSIEAVTIAGGDAMLAGASDDGSATIWSVDLSSGAPSAQAVAATGWSGWSDVTAAATTTDGAAVYAGTEYDVDGNENAVLWTLQDGEVKLADNGSPTAMVTGTVGDAPATFVIGTDFGDPADDADDASALWVVQGTGATEHAIDGDAHSVAFADGHVFVGETAGDWGKIVEIDPATGDQTAAAAFGDGDQGIAGSVSGLAASADGTVLYAAAGYGLYAIPVAHFADFDAETADALGADGWIGAIALSQAPGAPVLHASSSGDEGDSIVTFGAPAKPTLAVSLNDYDPAALDLTIGGDATRDSATVTPAGGEPAAAPLEYCSYDDTADSTSCQISGLARGTTYDVVVTRTNILGSTDSDPATMRTPGLLAGPSTVTFAGSPVVGATLTANVGAGWPAGTAFTYAWAYGGENFGSLAGTGPTLKVTPNMAGLQLWLQVTGRKDGDLRTASSVPVLVKAAPATQLPALIVRNKKATPKITGKAKVGSTVTAASSAWPKGTKVRFQWYANSKPIKGATKKHLKLTKKLKGKRVTVVATGTKPGFAPAIKKSKPIRVR